MRKEILFVLALGIAWAGLSTGAETEAPDYFQNHLKNQYSAFPVESSIVDFGHGDLDGDGREEMVGLYRNSYTIAPSEATGGKQAKQHQTMLVVFVPGPDGMIFEDDARLRWCEGDRCVGVAVTDEGRIQVRQVHESGETRYESLLTLTYEDGRFSPTGPPQERVIEPAAAE